jgi:hypothetical protein
MVITRGMLFPSRPTASQVNCKEKGSELLDIQSTLITSRYRHSLHSRAAKNSHALVTSWAGRVPDSVYIADAHSQRTRQAHAECTIKTWHQAYSVDVERQRNGRAQPAP